MKKLTKWVQSFFPTKMPEKKILEELYTQIRTSLTSAYTHPSVKSYLSSQTTQSLMKKAVEYYVGSTSCPRNENIARIILEQAKTKSLESNSIKDLETVKYHIAYFIKLDSLQKGDKREYDRSSELFMELSEEGNQLASYLTGKQIYQLLAGDEFAKDKEEVTKNCVKIFQKSLVDEQFGGLYYIAELENSLPNSSYSKEQIFQLYCMAASLGYPLAYFKLAILYKQRGQYQAYMRYLKQAAEKGVLQAQHNLGVEYMRGETVPKNEFKALGWFMNAGGFGFGYSKFNAAKILAQGTQCGKVPQNRKAALVLMEEIHRTGEIDLEEEIKELMNVVDK